MVAKHHALFTRIDQRAREFCLIRSYLQTASKHGICWLGALADAMRGHPLDAHHRNRLTRRLGSWGGALSYVVPPASNGPGRAGGGAVLLAISSMTRARSASSCSRVRVSSVPPLIRNVSVPAMFSSPPVSRQHTDGCALPLVPGIGGLLLRGARRGATRIVFSPVASGVFKVQRTKPGTREPAAQRVPWYKS